MTALRFGAWLASVLITIGAGVCLRDAWQLYREAPGDPLFRLPGVVAIVLLLIVVGLISCTGDP